MLSNCIYFINQPGELYMIFLLLLALFFYFPIYTMELQSDYFEVWAQKYNRQESIAEKKSIFKDYYTHYDPQACDFIQSVQTRAIEKALKNFVELDDNVKRMVIIRARALKSFWVEFFILPKDTFASFLECCMPAYRKAVPLLQDYQSCNNVPIVNVPAKNVLPQAPLDKIFKHNAVSVLSILSRYMSKESFTLRYIIEKPSTGKFDYVDSYITKDYQFTFDDLLRIDEDTQKLLEDIATCSQQGAKAPNQRYCVTEEDQKKLLAIQQVITDNAVLNTLQINIHYPQRTYIQKAKDTMLFAFPLFLTSHVIPQLIYSYASGKLLWCTGGLITYMAGFVVGKRVFPCFDYCHSSAFEWRKWFGKDNYTPPQHKWSFAILSLIHYIALSIAGKCLKITYCNIGNVLGYGLHLWRLFIACKGIFAEDSSMWYLKKYDDVVSRRSRHDKSATLGDLVNN